MEQNKKQTAIEWLEEHLKSQYDIDIGRLSVTDKAKSMEREQIENAFDAGEYWDFYDPPRPKTYYNETYGMNQ
jgi:hypothetical protein